ncbi:MAG: AbrB/MazE/SpoVT family DNA-binding domain-containing protein [Thermoprotei archaeon]|nr:MAG: AbrB/MazE/SpoVT family DNA-binding domain-containing protein [Thermoprotei archaeon]
MSRKSKREVLGVSKITYKFQVTIPKTVRERFGLKEGDILVFMLEDGKLVLVKSTEL